MNSLDFLRPECSVEELARPEFIADDFAAAGIESKDDIRAALLHELLLRLRGRRQNDPLGLRSADGLSAAAVFSSDFTHFDVPDFADVIPEAFEMVVTEQDFREFTFTNAAMLHTRNNPGFFKDTVVEGAVADELGLERASPAATAWMQD
jgi:hypothetical protein